MSAYGYFVEFDQYGDVTENPDLFSSSRSRCVLLDGGLGSEIRRRGIQLHPSAWSACATLEAPAVLRAIHCDYIAAGADVITANTFSASMHNLEHAGLGDVFREMNHQAVMLARSAAGEISNRKVLVAGSMSTIPPMDAPDSLFAGQVAFDNYRRQGEILAAAGADLIIAEMLLDRVSARVLVDACLEVGLPVWAGFSAGQRNSRGDIPAFRASGKYLEVEDQTLREVLDFTLRPEIDVAGIMHTKTANIAGALRELKKVWNGQIMAYGETGRSGDSDWFFDEIEDPATYATKALQWVEDYGVSIIGGCCGTDPTHIRDLNEKLP